MIAYKNLNGNSGVAAYKIGPDFIDVKFHNTIKPYQYSYASAGSLNVEHMKKLASEGRELNSFIMKNVCKLYVK